MADAGRRRPLKVGIQLPEVEYVAPWRTYAAMARKAEASDSTRSGSATTCSTATRTTSRRGRGKAWTLMTALAGVTEKVEIGPLVACTSFHNPAMLAKKAATLEEISGGRLILGLGAGWNEPEYRAYGFPYDNRVSRFEEAFAIIRTLLRRARSTFTAATTRRPIACSCQEDRGPRVRR
jgi:alkanesulfonate monooxygenase SsuD/methylene tetrahydromethanopterin reductase-like flavin-dependent oxidoreductase (luciferase family)